jgi:hypothetical protein
MALAAAFRGSVGKTSPSFGEVPQGGERVADYLLGSDEIDARLSPFAQTTPPQVREVLEGESPSPGGSGQRVGVK